MIFGKYIKQTCTLGVAMVLALWVSSASATGLVINTNVFVEESTLTLRNSQGAVIPDQRVDLLRANNSNTGVRTTTENGVASFDILPGYEHKFQVYYNGGSYVTEPVVYGDDAEVQTRLTKLRLMTHSEAPITDARVDLLRENESNTGVRLTVHNGPEYGGPEGEYAFEILPENIVRFKVYYNGENYVTDPVPCGETLLFHLGVQASTISLVLLDGNGQPIAGQRVDLLRSNNSNTGVRANTDGSGSVTFDALPETDHRLMVYHNGGSYITDVVALGVPVTVSTHRTELKLVNSTEGAIGNQRVDLLRSNGSNTGVRTNTDATTGVASFEVLPGYAHKFLVYHNGGSYTTGLKTYAINGTYAVEGGVTLAGDAIRVATLNSELKLMNSAGGVIENQRVDLLRSNGSNTGVRTNTNKTTGVASFEVLPGYAHKFLVYHNGGSYTTGLKTYATNGTYAVEDGVALAGDAIRVATSKSELKLVNSIEGAIGNQRVDLLRANGSNTGVRANTDATTGVASFEILPGYAHKFLVYHNGGSYTTGLKTYATNGTYAVEDGVALAGDAIRVATSKSELKLVNSIEGAIGNQRVDLLRSNGSNTGVRANTGEETGVASFEILPGYAHKFLVYHNGGSYTTGLKTYATNGTYAVEDGVALAGDAIRVATSKSELKLVNSIEGAIGNQRVDLLRSNGSNTGVRANTGEETGVASFEILPGYGHKFLVYHNGGSYTTGLKTYATNGTYAVEDGVALAGDAIRVQTEASTVILQTSGGPLGAGLRVELLRANDSNTGVRETTGENGSATFEILPGYTHKFKAYVSGAGYFSAELTGGEDGHILVPLAKPALAKPVVEEEPEVFAFGLEQNFPNPFNPTTTIRYTLGEASDVRLVIYNVLGQEVRVLVDAAQHVGLHNVVWDGRDALGRHVASGMYIYHLQAGQNLAIRKLLFAK